MLGNFIIVYNDHSIRIGEMRGFERPNGKHYFFDRDALEPCRVEVYRYGELLSCQPYHFTEENKEIAKLLEQLGNDIEQEK